MGKILTYEQFLEKLPKNRNYEIIGNYSDKGSYIEVKSKYGNHLSRRDGLIKNYPLTIQSAINKTEYFINQAKEIHGDKYTYKDFKYTLCENKSIICCSIHGNFEQNPKSHLDGKGCYKCGREAGSFKRSDFIIRAKGKECTFYNIRLFNDNEEFYKIGITKNKITERFEDKTLMPYSYEIIQEIKGEAGEIFDLELKNKRLLKDFKYTPKIKFSGHTECFSQLTLTNN